MTMPYTDLALNPIYLDWVNQVHQRGAGATKMPSGPYKGAPAEKFPAYQAGLPASGYTYTLAPANVLRAWRDELSDEAETMRRAAIVEAIASGFRTVASIPGDAIHAVTGLPKWLIPVGLGVLILVGAKSVFPHLSTRRNPRGRRRRRPSRRR